MADFEQTLNSLLSDPDAMGQIMALAGKLGGAPSAPQEAPSAQESVPSPEESPAAQDVFSSEEEGEVQEVFSPQERPEHQGFHAPQEDTSPFPDLDQLAKMGQLMELFQTAQADPETMALLSALRPFLREDRQRKLDRAMRLASLSRAARTAIRLWKDGELHV